MCKAKPGPRCSAHTSAALTEAAQHLADAERHLLAAQAQSGDPTIKADPNRRALAYEHHKDARARETEARTAYLLARREHDSTPTGQRELRALLDADPTNDDRVAYTQRLEDGQRLRAQQEFDLNVAQGQQARWDAASGVDRERMQQADQACQDAESDLQRARRAAADAENAASQARTAGLAAMDREVEANLALQRAIQQGQQAADVARTRARDLYVAAGVSEQFATYYANDMVESASQFRGGTVVRPLTMKVKRQGRDREATLRARAAAESDPQFVSANERVAQTVQQTQEARRAQAAASMSGGNHELQEASRKARNAQEAVRDAETRLARATGDRDLLYARVGAGLGSTPMRQVALSQVRENLVRNPDGTTNAYAYREPSAGFPHGRLTRATGVTYEPRLGANAVTFDDGSQHAAARRVFRDHRGFVHEGTDVTLHLIDPVEGARPLQDEVLAGTGLYSFVDSGD